MHQPIYDQRYLNKPAKLQKVTLNVEQRKSMRFIININI